MEMSVKQKIAQMLICTPSVKNFEKDVRTLIEEYQIGGIILYSKHYNSYQEMLEKINYIKQYKCTFSRRDGENYRRDVK